MASGNNGSFLSFLAVLMNLFVFLPYHPLRCLTEAVTVDGFVSYLREKFSVFQYSRDICFSLFLELFFIKLR